jgi:nicotinic acid mononucleotide adenylyltransferase
LEWALVSYGLAHHGFSNIWLAAMSVFIGGFIPYYSKISNKLEELVNFYAATVSLGRLSRFILQLIFNLFIFGILTHAKVVPANNLTSMGGVVGIALLTTFASQGMQYVALALANREVGEKTRNVLAALSINIIVTALATLGLPVAKTFFIVLGVAFGLVFFVIGIFSDWRGKIYPRKGVGVFFGTFNPIHRTHLALIEQAISERGLDKVYIHCTTVPKLHAQALLRGEIRISRYEYGMRVYETTQRADVHMNYFPTGRKFYEYETRLEMMRLSVKEAGLAGKVVVLDMRDLYEIGGFYSVLSHIKKMNPNQPIHGIHGSDLGGMWVRSIYDESGWIYPVSFIRKDKVSATAIRNGEKGMTTSAVQQMIEALRQANDLAIPSKIIHASH